MSAASTRCLHSARGATSAIAPCRSLGRKAFNGRLVNTTTQRKGLRVARATCKAATDVTSGTFPVSVQTLSFVVNTHVGLGLEPSSDVFFLQPPLVGNEAPDFLAQAVFDQEFVEVSLSQYRVSTSSLQVLHSIVNETLSQVSQCAGKVCCAFLLPSRFHFCLPDRDHSIL